MHPLKSKTMDLCYLSSVEVEHDSRTSTVKLNSWVCKLNVMIMIRKKTELTGAEAKCRSWAVKDIVREI